MPNIFDKCVFDSLGNFIWDLLPRQLSDGQASAMCETGVHWLACIDTAATVRTKHKMINCCSCLLKLDELTTGGHFAEAALAFARRSTVYRFHAL